MLNNSVCHVVDTITSESNVTFFLADPIVKHVTCQIQVGGHAYYRCWL